MNLKKLFNPFIYFITIIGFVLGTYSWITDTRSFSSNAVFFLISSIALVIWEDEISSHFGASFSSSLSFLLLCLFNIKIAIITIICCALSVIIIDYINGVFKKQFFFRKLMFNICNPIMAICVTWGLSKFMSIDYGDIFDFWKLLVLCLIFDLISAISVNLIIIFSTGEINIVIKDAFTHMFYNAIMSIILIYTYYDRGILGILFVSIMFIPVHKLSNMHSKLKSQEQELFVDALTKVYNLRFFKSLMHDKISNHVAFTLIYLDLNDLDKINNEYGYDSGNRVLQHFAEQLKRKFSNRSTICRYGEDEFCIITDNDNNDIESIIKNLENQKSFHTTIEGKRIEYSTSFGFSHYDGTNASDWRTILKSADKVMYESKQNHSGTSTYA